MRRDRAIARTAIRDLAPVHLGALGLGVLIALPQLDTRLTWGGDPWPFVAIPSAAVWAGIMIGGTKRATFVHMLARPVSRSRWLA